MATHTYTRYSSPSSTGANSNKVYEVASFTVPSGEKFNRLKINRTAMYGKVYLRGKAKDILGASGWDTWTTKKDAAGWSNGSTSRIEIRNDNDFAQQITISVTFETVDEEKYTITCSAGTGGTLTASKTSAIKGTEITLTPTANSGYKLKTLTVTKAGGGSVTVSNNKFTMPAANVTCAATFEKTEFTITKATSPTGAGTVTTKISGTDVTKATKGQTVTVGQTPGTGYKFVGWTTAPNGLIASGGSSFTMPASAVTVTANYQKRSTATIDKQTLPGGGSATVIISADKTAYSHKLELSFGGSMVKTQSVSPGTKTVTLSIPDWNSQVPNAATKTGGTLTVSTYSSATQNESTLIGTYTISSLTYSVPASVVPTIGTITTSIAKTISGVTYNYSWSLYVQNHCGVRTQVTGSGAGGSTISSMKIAISGYSKSPYNKTVQSASLDVTSGLLTIAGTATITITATDSRGRTATKTKTITVTAYEKPTGTLKVWRVDANGDADDMGQYAKYQYTATYKAIGTNSLTKTLTSKGSSATNPGTSGNLLPSSRQTFDTLKSFTISLALQDQLETVTITAVLPSAKYIIHVNKDGDKIGFMKAADRSIPSGKDSTIEFSGNAQIYIGTKTLEQFIRDVINNS